MIPFANKFRKFFFLILFFCPVLTFAGGNESDSLTLLSKRRANKATLMSAVVPGLGQIYNKKYWKLPILYGASGALIYFIKTNDTEFNKFRKALLYRYDEDSLTADIYPRYTDEDLTVRKDYYRRNRDLSYILAVVLYSLNIVDAYVDSQLMNFDISDNLSLRSGGTLNYLHDGSPVACINFVLSFK